MPTYQRKAGATSQIVTFRVYNTDGSPKTGLVYTDFTAYYSRDGGTATSITLASGTVGDSYSSGKVAEISSTNAPGEYALHVPNAAIAASASMVRIAIKSGSYIIPPITVNLVAYDPQSSVLGMGTQKLYVTKSGSDSNDGLTYATAKLTVSGAVSAASNGDTIFIGAGTYTEQVSAATKQLTYIGAGRTKTIITRSTTGSDTFLPGPGSVIKSMKVAFTGTGASGILATYTDGLIIDDCYVQGDIDAITLHGSKNVRVTNCELYGQWDGTGMNDCQNFVFENNYSQTNCEYSWNGSAYTSDTSMHGAVFGGVASGVIRNCWFYAERQHTTTQQTNGLRTGTNVLVENCQIRSYCLDSLSSGYTFGTQYGLINAVQGSVTTLRGCEIATYSDSVANSRYDMSLSTGAYLIDAGSKFTRTSIDGAGTLVDQQSKMTDQGYTSTLAGNLGTRVDAAISSRLASADLVVRSNTAQAGASSTITLDASASSTGSIYVGQVIVVGNQVRTITAYNGTTKVATVDRAWASNPSNGSAFVILAVNSPALDSSLQVTSSNAGSNVSVSVEQTEVSGT